MVYFLRKIDSATDVPIITYVLNIISGFMKLMKAAHKFITRKNLSNIRLQLKCSTSREN